MVINGDITAGQNLVIISNGDVTRTAGTIRSDNIGIGAQGTIGTSTANIPLETETLALSPENGFVSDTDGFEPAEQVSAVGATVNQGSPMTPTRPTTPTPVAVTLPVTVALTSLLIPDALPDALAQVATQPEIFAQNSADLVEAALVGVIQLNPAELRDIDPTRIPSIWFDDEQFLRQKFRR